MNVIQVLSYFNSYIIFQVVDMFLFSYSEKMTRMCPAFTLSDFISNHTLMCFMLWSSLLLKVMRLWLWRLKEQHLKPSPCLLQVGKMDLKVSWRELHQLSPSRKTRRTPQPTIPNHFFHGPNQQVPTMNPCVIYLMGKRLFQMSEQQTKTGPNPQVFLLSHGAKRSMILPVINSSLSWDVLTTAIPFGWLRTALLLPLF